MKINKKFVTLIKHGLSGELLTSLNENQLTTLYNRLVETKEENKEQTQPGVTTTITTERKTTINPSALNTPAGVTLDGVNLKNQGGQIVATQMREEQDLEDLALADETRGMNPDEALALSMTEKKEMDEKFESKAQQKLFWAKCGEGKTKEEKKWCEMAKEYSKSTSKKQYEKMPEKKHPEKSIPKGEYSEGYMDMIGKAINNGLKSQVAKTGPNMSWGTKLEHKISQLVEKNLNPKMTKKDLVNLVTKKETKEQAPVTAPPKPTTKPTTKPNKPSTPYQPKPGPKKAPKAGKENLPDWLTSKNIGLK